MRGPHRIRERGLSLVELMVGIAISLFVIAGALKVYAGHLESSRHALTEARLDREVRMAANMIAREIRRAGYWRDAGHRNVADNPYAKIDAVATASPANISYAYGGDVDEASDASIRLKTGVLQLRVGGDNGNGWQAITDAESVNVTQFTVTPKVTNISLGDLCIPVCSIENTKCPRLQSRSYDITIVAQALADAQVRRETREAVHVRNHALPEGTCP